MNDSEELQQIITQRIQQSERQRITFAEFMALALYHPQFGYYATPSSIIGPQGDFITLTWVTTLAKFSRVVC